MARRMTMRDKTRDKLDDLLDAVDSDPEISVTAVDIKEYYRGDPTVPETKVTGAEIELNCAFQFESVDDDDESRYRVN